MTDLREIMEEYRKQLASKHNRPDWDVDEDDDAYDDDDDCDCYD